MRKCGMTNWCNNQTNIYVKILQFFIILSHNQLSHKYIILKNKLDLSVIYKKNIYFFALIFIFCLLFLVTQSKDKIIKKQLNEDEHRRQRNLISLIVKPYALPGSGDVGGWDFWRLWCLAQQHVKFKEHRLRSSFTNSLTITSVTWYLWCNGHGVGSR